jgi:hypothetical protein
MSMAAESGLHPGSRHPLDLHKVAVQDARIAHDRPEEMVLFHG